MQRARAARTRSARAARTGVKMRARSARGGKMRARSARSGDLPQGKFGEGIRDPIVFLRLRRGGRGGHPLFIHNRPRFTMIFENHREMRTG